MTQIIYNATRTSSQFHNDDSFFRLLFGAVRTGKTVSSANEIIIRCAQQEADKKGIRRSRWVVVRSTYPQLKSTTIKTWTEWFPEKYFGKIKWDSPITHHLKFNDIDAEILFMPIESENDIAKLKSLEATGFYINELQYLPRVVLTTCLERCNSFPPRNSGASITFTGVIADTNPPSTRHWLNKMEKELPSNYKVFKYDPAVIKVLKLTDKVAHAISLDGTIYVNNPKADYIKNLPNANYYLNLIPGLSDEEVKVACLGDYGFSRAGKAVYPDYNSAIHYRGTTIRYNPDETLYMGWDFGLTPAVVFFQYQAGGYIAAIKEINSQDVGVEKFASEIVIPFLNSNFNGWQSRHVSIGDPAGVQRNQVTMSTPIEALNNLGIKTRPASTNDPEKRISAVSWWLRRSHNGVGILWVTKDAPVLHEGMLGDYQFEKINIGGFEESTKSSPLKNFSSHTCEAAQYILMHLRDLTNRSDDKDELTGSTIY